MPARRLSDQPTRLAPYDILGRTDGSTDLMVHALLCNELHSRTDVTQTSAINCVHMGPPLGRCAGVCEAVGSAGLGEGRRRKVKDFVNNRFQERKAARKRWQTAGQPKTLRMEYRIYPAATKPSPEFSLWRFSCTGFVLEAYRTARIRLLGEPLPQISLVQLKTYYPEVADKLDDFGFRKRMGIGEGDRWPVSLVGYLLNSLAREVDEIHKTPYVPQSGDEYFPPRALDTMLT